MNALLWKDVRQSGQVLWIGAILLGAPYLAASLWELYEPGSNPSAAVNWARILYGASYFSLSASQLTLALLAGHTIAGERVDRSAEFLAALPVSRGRILASKAALGVVVLLIVWGVNLPVRWWMGDIANDPDLNALELGPIAAGSLLVFGIAWLGSSYLESPTYAAALGIIAPLVVMTGLVMTNHFWHWLPKDESLGAYYVVGFVLGPLGLVAGTAYYLHRVEP